MFRLRNMKVFRLGTTFAIVTSSCSLTYLKLEALFKFRSIKSTRQLYMHTGAVYVRPASSETYLILGPKRRPLAGCVFVKAVRIDTTSMPERIIHIKRRSFIYIYRYIYTLHIYIYVCICHIMIHN